MVDTYTAAGPLDKVRARVEQVAERADGVFLTPATYFIEPERIAAYQSRIVEAFGPAASRAESAGELRDEPLELLDLAQRRAVADADDRSGRRSSSLRIERRFSSGSRVKTFGGSRTLGSP